MGTTKKTTKKVTTGSKSAKTSAPMETRVKAETKPAAKVEVAPAKTAPVAKTEVVAASTSMKTAPVAKTEVAASTSVKTAPVAKTEVVVDAAPVKLVSKHEVTELIREAAFLFAKRRNFRNGTPTQDWFAAEAFVNERLTARGYTVSA